MNYFEKLTERFASALFFAIFAILIALIAMLFGCESQNPICGDTLCVDGSVFLKSELPAGAEYDAVSIDESVILATLVGTPVPVEPTLVEPPTPPAIDDSVTFADIVTDVASGNRKYVEKIVSIVASVEKDTSEFDNNDAITLQTDNENVWFFVLSRSAPEKLQNYEEGQSYTFNVLILNISPPEPPSSPQHVVWSYLPPEPIFTTMDTVIADMTAGGTTYLEKIISISATVQSGTEVFFDENTDYETISLVTNNPNVSFFVYNNRYPPAMLNQYQKNNTYDFKLFIYQIFDSTSGKKLVGSVILLD